MTIEDYMFCAGQPNKIIALMSCNSTCKTLQNISPRRPHLTRCCTQNITAASDDLMWKKVIMSANQGEPHKGEQ